MEERNVGSYGNRYLGTYRRVWILSILLCLIGELYYAYSRSESKFCLWMGILMLLHLYRYVKLPAFPLERIQYPL